MWSIPFDALHVVKVKNMFFMFFIWSVELWTMFSIQATCYDMPFISYLCHITTTKSYRWAQKTYAPISNITAERVERAKLSAQFDIVFSLCVCVCVSTLELSTVLVAHISSIIIIIFCCKGSNRLGCDFRIVLFCWTFYSIFLTFFPFAVYFVFCS